MPCIISKLSSYELHFVHALSAEHGREVTLCGGIAHEVGDHLQALRQRRCLHVVGDPLYNARRELEHQVRKQRSWCQSEALVDVFHQLMDGQNGVTRFHHGVRHFGGRDHGEGGHDSSAVLFGDEFTELSSDLH